LASADWSSLLQDLVEQIKPYRGQIPAVTRLPENGWDRRQVLHLLEDLRSREEGRWKAGYASGAVYHGGDEHLDFINRVYALHSQSNPLHPDLWPSTIKFEAEIVAMTARMLGAAPREEPTSETPGPPKPNGAGLSGEVVGTVTSGGTESILLAVKTYRDWARARRGVTSPEMIVPETAHAAFDKAAQYFGVRLVRIPVDGDFRADVAAARRALNDNTILIVGSAPSFPHGIIDPIAELAALAQEKGIGCHVDACLGGFILPWAEKLGYPVPPFDFRVPGVTSLSADTHKYGYAPKGSSVILYRGRELRRYQYYVIADWPGGLYFSPTFAGSRPGALSVAAWATMVAMGEEGYLEATRRILETAASIKEGIRSIPELHVLGDPLWVIAFTSAELNIYQIMEHMLQRGWSLNALQRPAALHLATTLRHTEAGVAERFVADLRWAVDQAKAHPQKEGALAPVYGLTTALPADFVREVLRTYLDLLYEP